MTLETFVTMLAARMTRAALARAGRRACIVQARAGPAVSFHATSHVGAKKSKKDKGKGSSSSSSSATASTGGGDGGGADEAELAFAADDDDDDFDPMQDADDTEGRGGGGGGGAEEEGPQLPDLAKLAGRMTGRVTRFVDQLKRIRGGNSTRVTDVLYSQVGSVEALTPTHTPGLVSHSPPLFLAPRQAQCGHVQPP